MKHLIFYCIVVISFLSCQNNSNNIITKEFIESLKSNNIMLDISTKNLMSNIKAKTLQDELKDKALFWLSKSETAITKSKEFVTAIDSNTTTKKENDKLYRNFLGFFKNTEPNIYSELKYLHFDTLNSNINNLDLVKELYKNKVYKFRTLFIEICLKQIGTPCGYEKYQVLISQNSTHFKPNEKLEVTAGVGAFIYKAQPKVYIDGKLEKANEDNVTEVFFNVGNIKGNFSKKVKVTFVKPDGRSDSIVKEIKYIVD